MIELIRFRMDDRGTFGALVIPGHGSLVTVERPWIDEENGTQYPYGAPQQSCIPAGEYKLSREHSNRYGKAMWHLIGEGVSYQPTFRPYWRSNVMFHAANRAEELMGCIAPGKIYDPAGQVLKSQTALGELTLALGQIAKPMLRIRNAW